MELMGWCEFLERAYAGQGARIDPLKRELLLTKLPESLTPEQEDFLAETANIIWKEFFNFAVLGKTFGDINKIKKRFGSSVEENYGLTEGPFIKTARTYWTYKLEIKDLFPKHKDIALAQILADIEISIAGLFFPTPGPAHNNIPFEMRRRKQIEILTEYAPKMDIHKFITENPILGTEKKKGCLGLILALICPLLLLLIITMID